MAKATALVFLLIAALLCHLHTGDARRTICDKSDVVVAIDRMGEEVQGQTKYKVGFWSRCACEQKDVHVVCVGLEKSALPLDTSKVEDDDGVCVLKQPIAKGSPLFIDYSSAVPLDFRVFKADASC